MAKTDSIIRASGRARSHQKYTTSSGEPVPGGSTLASLIQFGGVDGLLHWAVKLHKEGQDFKTFRTESAEFGNCAHRAVECLFKGERFDEENFPGAYTGPARVMAEEFFKTLGNMGLEMVGSEIQAVSDEQGWGGTMDLILKHKGEDGPTVLGDLKTSNSVNTSHVIQVAGCYAELFRVVYGEEPKRVVLFRMDRNPPHTCIPHEVADDQRVAAREAAVLARALWAIKAPLTRKF